MTREEFITAAEIAFERLMTPTRGVRPGLMEEPMADGQWSLRDMAAHFAYWNAVAVRALEEIHQGREFDWTGYADFDLHNARAIERSKGQSLKHVMGELRITHSAVVEIVRRMPQDKLCDENGELPEWLAETVIEHYVHHTPQVEHWVAKLKSEGRGPAE